MRWGLFSVRLSISIVGILTAMLIVMTVIPLINGGLKVEMPKEDQVHWELQGEVVSAQAPIRIFNGGYLSIDDFHMWVVLTDANGAFLSESSSPTIDLRTNEWTTVTLPFVLDLSTLSDEKRMDIVLNGTDVNIKIGIDAYFGLRTIHTNIEAGGNQTMHIPALISQLDIDVDRVSLEQSEVGYDIVVPYSFSAADLLSGQTLNLVSQMSNISGPLGQARGSITIQNQNSGQLRYSITEATAKHLLTEPDTLLFSTTVDLGGISFEKDVRYYWSPLIRDLGVDEVRLASNIWSSSLLIDYHFRALPLLQGQSIQVDCTITDVHGTICNGTDRFTISSINQRTMTMNVAQSVAAQLIGVDEEWTIAMHFVVNDIETTVYTIYHWNGDISEAFG